MRFNGMPARHAIFISVFVSMAIAIVCDGFTGA
jgi:hypothetical protein